MTPYVETILPESAFRTLVDPGSWQRLASVAETVDVPAGGLLIRRGESGLPLFVIERGRFEVIDSRSSPETVLDMLGPGQVVGEMAFTDGGPATADVRARAPGLVLRWEREVLLARLEADTALARAFYRALARSVAARSRKVMSAAIAGGFGAAGTRERADAVELDRAAYALASDLLDALAGAAGPGDAARPQEVGRALTATCRWFTVVGDAGRAAEIGARMRDLLGAVLSSSATTAAMLARPEGKPAGPELFRHILQGEPAGSDRAGQIFDAALLGLPTLRGWRWRDRTLAQTLASALPGRAPRVLSVSLTGAPISNPQVEILRARTGHVTSVQLSPRLADQGAPPGMTRTTLVADLPSLLRGTGPRIAERQHVVIVDRVSDVVPDEVLRALLLWARGQLQAGGTLLVGHATPSDDVALLDHLLRWPSLPRRSAAVVGLLPPNGTPELLAPDDDEAAGLILWRPQA